MAGSDITLVAGLEGGGSIYGTSGKKIKNQLENIIKEVNAKGNLNIKPKLDYREFRSQLGKLTGDAVTEANKIRTAYEQAFQSLLQIQKHGGGTGGGSGSENQYSEAIRYNQALAKTESLLKQVHNAQKKWAINSSTNPENYANNLKQQAENLEILLKGLRGIQDDGSIDLAKRIPLDEFGLVFSQAKADFAEISEEVDNLGQATRAINKDALGYIEALSKIDKAQEQVEKNIKDWAIADETGSKTKAEYDALKALVGATGDFAKLKKELADGVIKTDAGGRQYIEYLTADDVKERLSAIVREAEKLGRAIKNAGESTHRLVPSSDSEEYVNNLSKVNSELKKAKDNQKKWNAAKSGDQGVIDAYNEIGNQIAALDSLKARLEAGALTVAQFNDEYKKISTTLSASYDKISSSDFGHSETDDFKKFTSQLTELDTAIEKNKQSLREWSAAKDGVTSDDYDGIQEAIEKLQRMRDELLKTGQALKTFDDDMAGINKNVATHSAGIKNNNKDYKTFGDNVLGIFEEVGQYFDVMDLVFEGIQYGRQMVEAVTDIDTAMTELKKVTDETDAAYASFMDKAVTRATDLGASVADVVSASADFARLGHDLGDASTLADAAIVYKNVGDGIKDISEASSSIVSTMQAFGIEASDAMSIVDKFNHVSNNYAISSDGLGSALQRSASAMAAAHATLDETVALAAAANTVVDFVPRHYGNIAA